MYGLMDNHMKGSGVIMRYVGRGNYVGLMADVMLGNSKGI